MTGSGTPADPYIIYDVDDLQAIEDHLASYYELGGNIDAAATSDWNGGEGFIPITVFTGQLDGKGYTISDLFINRLTAGYQALFGRIDGSAVVKNVNMTGLDITTGYNYYTAGLVARVVGGSCSILSCSTAGSINSGIRYIGGLIGRMDGGTVELCYSTCTVASPDYGVGGLVGYMVAGDIDQCYATGDVGSITTYGVGGFVGYAAGGTIDDCYAKGNVTGSSLLGGFIGETGSVVIDDCYSTGLVLSSIPRLTITTDEGVFEVTSDNRDNFNGEGYLSGTEGTVYLDVHDDAGWFATNYNHNTAVGQRYNIYGGGKYQISRSVIRFDISNVTGTILSAVMSILPTSQVHHFTDWDFVLVDGSDCGDPLVAADYGDLLDEVTSLGVIAVSAITEWTFFEITLTAAGRAFLQSKVGSVAVFGVRSSDDIGSIPPPDYDAGEKTEMAFVCANVTYEGGLSGRNSGTITNSFWDTETSELALSDGGTGKTTAQMKTESTFTDAGWDFTTPIWYINRTINDGYPAFIGVVRRIKGNPNIDQRIFQHVERIDR